MTRPLWKPKRTTLNFVKFVLYSFAEQILKCCVENTAATLSGCQDDVACLYSQIAGPMFVTRDREKLLNAIIYFLRETKHCHTLKLFKLLNFSDFEHFRQTGRTIFNLKYKAWDKGPVPTKLWGEFKFKPSDDLKKHVLLNQFKDGITDKTLRLDLKPLKKFDKQYFSKREMAILERVAFLFKELKADDMSEFSHMKHLPWAAVYKNGKGSNEEIPPELALESEPLINEAPTLPIEEVKFRQELLRDSV